MAMKILVTGTRRYADERRVAEVLDALEPTLVIEGAAKGADKLAHEWAIDRGVANDRYHAEWERYGRAAGPIRNERMLKEGAPDLVVAFPEAGGRGTQNMMKQALKAGVPVIDATGLGGLKGCDALEDWVA